jgi:cation/acetate symporter
MSLDANSTSPARSRAGLALVAVALIVVFGLAGLSVLVRLGASATLVDGCYWALGIAMAAALAVGAGMRPDSPVSPLFGGLAIAADTISAAFFLALAGAIFAWGHDGLAFAIGLGAGCLLLQLVVAPRLADSGAHSLSGFFATRYPGRVAGALCALTIVLSMLLLLMAELMAAGLVGARLLDIDFAIAAAIAACAVLACFVVRGLSGAAWVNGVLFPIMLVAILVPLVMLSAQWYELPVPELAYANALWQVQGIEEKLIEQDLADPAVMRPMLTAFLALTPMNFLGVVLGLAAGVAALPSMLPAQLATVSARHARHAALWGLGFVALLLTLTPAVAAYAKLSFIQLLVDRTPIAELPSWIFTYGKLGLVEICGRAATNAAAAAEACAALPETAQGLRLQDITLNPDAVVLALPDMAELDHLVLGLLAATALAVAIATANGPLRAIVRALGRDDPPSGAERERRNSRLASYAVAALALTAATGGALLGPLSILDAATYAFVIAAVGLFPALFAGLWWRHANAYGAAAAMLAGLAIAIVYLVGARYFAVPFYEWTAELSNAGAEGFASVADLKNAWIAAAPGADKEAAWTALQAQARDNANWWGVDGLAVALLALPAGFVALVVVSLVTPAPRPAKTAP